MCLKDQAFGFAKKETPQIKATRPVLRLSQSPCRGRGGFEMSGRPAWPACLSPCMPSGRLYVISRHLRTRILLNIASNDTSETISRYLGSRVALNIAYDDTSETIARYLQTRISPTRFRQGLDRVYVVRQAPPTGFRQLFVGRQTPSHRV